MTIIRASIGLGNSSVPEKLLSHIPTAILHVLISAKKKHFFPLYRQRFALFKEYSRKRIL